MRDRGVEVDLVEPYHAPPKDADPAELAMYDDRTGGIDTDAALTSIDIMARADEEGLDALDDDELAFLASTFSDQLEEEALPALAAAQLPGDETWVAAALEDAGYAKDDRPPAPVYDFKTLTGYDQEHPDFKNLADAASEARIPQAFMDKVFEMGTNLAQLRADRLAEVVVPKDVHNRDNRTEHWRKSA